MDVLFGWMKLEREGAPEEVLALAHEEADLAAPEGEVGVVIPEVRRGNIFKKLKLKVYSNNIEIKTDLTLIGGYGGDRGYGDRSYGDRSFGGGDRSFGGSGYRSGGYSSGGYRENR